jgi:hypothetical protein
MKILQINTCHYRRGGADVVYLNTIALLKERGHQVIDFSQASDKNEPSDYEENFVENYEVHELSLLDKIKKSPRLLYSVFNRKNQARHSTYSPVQSSVNGFNITSAKKTQHPRCDYIA